MDQPNSTSNLGTSGENFVADWLQSQGALILARQWTCRSGELDLVVKTSDAIAERGASIVAFVEVKTRSRGNWDSDGVLSITPAKQTKLLTTAKFFLLTHPHLSEFPCRFDVALVRYQAQTRKRGNQPSAATSPHLTKNQFSIQNYIRDAFS
ncbi:YraN family protein [Leptolyngbya sp. FACHB-17]|uniref:YraN family protein n=1 Tax=unclassified Leptolyngbya TaxID=2650499 RepID=UPI0016803325|nr:YraN family protein [Leptolyngbya sp. FACHB-17]